MMRIPDWLFSILERVYLAQRHIRRRELEAVVATANRLAREHFARLRQQHEEGTCAGRYICPYAPCKSSN